MRVRTFHPIATLALGLSRSALLDRMDIPPRPFRYDLPLLFGLWALTSILFFVTLASLLVGLGAAHQDVLILATSTFGIASLAVTLYVASRPKHPALEADPSLLQSAFEASVYGDPFIAVIGTLVALLILFLLFFLWLPILLLLLGVVSLGGLWRAYRACLVVAEDGTSLAVLGGELLHHKAVLSRSWDFYLDAAHVRQAAEGRRRHSQLHRAFVALGLSSLTFGIVALLSRAIPSEGWMALLVPAGVLTVTTFVLLLWNVRAGIRRSRST